MDERSAYIKELIQSRRSIFPASYTDQPLPVAVIEEIIESANYAPSHKLTEPWRFTVCVDEGKLRLGQTMADLYKQHTPEEKFLQKKYDSIIKKSQQAGCIAVIKAQLHPDKLPEWEEIAALGCAVQNMALTATSLHVGSYWSSPGMIKHLGDFLELKENEQCFGIFYMGYHDAPERKAIRTPISEKVQWIKQ